MCNILGENLVDLEKEADKLELELENTKKELRISKNQINELGTFSKRMTIKETERLGNELRTKWKMDIDHFITKIEFRVSLSNSFDYSYLVKSSCDGENWSEIENCSQFDKKGGRKIFLFERRKMKYLALVIESNHPNGLIGGSVKDVVATML